MLDSTNIPFQPASGTCTATIDFEEGDTDKASWYEMWMAAVAVNEMCVKKGKAGAAFDLGKLILSIPLKNGY